MYIPKHFHSTNPTIPQNIMRERCSAAIVSVWDDGFPMPSHISVHWQAASLWVEDAPEHGVLLRHCARSNPHAQLLASHSHAAMHAAYAQGGELEQPLVKMMQRSGMVA